MQRISVAAGGPPTLPLFIVTDVVKEAFKVADNRFLPLAAWRSCAGFAHGRSCAALAFLEKEEFPIHDPEVVRLLLTNTLMKVWWVTKASHVLLTKAMELYKQRCTNRLDY